MIGTTPTAPPLTMAQRLTAILLRVEALLKRADTDEALPSDALLQAADALDEAALTAERANLAMSETLFSTLAGTMRDLASRLRAKAPDIAGRPFRLPHGDAP
jgi:hypothetical protein